MDIALTLTFSVVMLLFMIYPATRIVAWIEQHIAVPPRWHNPLQFGMVIVLSLLIGLFLRFF
jgi:hypothetical protein